MTSAAWSPDGEYFVTGSLRKESQLSLWNLAGEKVYSWAIKERIQDVALSPDGQRLVIISTEKHLFVYNFQTKEEIHHFELQSKLTCVNISKDSIHALVNLSNNQVQLINLNTGDLVRSFVGQKQGQYVIRSTFGGADENLVISGSEGNFAVFTSRWQPLMCTGNRWQNLHLAQGEWQAHRDS